MVYFRATGSNTIVDYGLVSFAIVGKPCFTLSAKLCAILQNFVCFNVQTNHRSVGANALYLITCQCAIFSYVSTCHF